MDAIKIPKFTKNALLEKDEYEFFMNMPLDLLKKIFMTVFYQQNGRGSKYKILGFDKLNYYNTGGTWYLELSGGIALIHDIIFSSTQEKETIMIFGTPQQGDRIVLTYQQLTYIGSQEKKSTVNDLTPLDSALNIKFEYDNDVTISRQDFLPDLKFVKNNEHIDERNHIELFVYSGLANDFLPGSVDFSVTLSQHRSSNKLPHPNGSITKEKLSTGIMGGHSTTVSTGKKDITVHEISAQIMELRGNFLNTSPQRLNGTLGGYLGYPPGWKLSTLNYYGIDDIFHDICQALLVDNARSGGGGGAPGTEWIHYNYYSKYTPSIAFRTGNSFRVNPAAIMHVAHGTRASAMSGVLSYNGIVYGWFNGAGNCVPHGINMSSIGVGDAAAFSSLQNVYFTYSPRHGGMFQDDTIFLFSQARLNTNKTVQVRSGVIRTNILFDTRYYKPFDASKFFESYEYEFDGNPPDDLEDFGTDSYYSRKASFNGGSNYFMVGKIGTGPGTPL